MTEESITSGRSVRPWISSIAPRISSTSSARGSATFTSRTSAPPATCSATSSSIWDRSPACSWAWKPLRPVGVIRSPMMQNGLPEPMTTVLDRDWRTVSMLNPFGVRGDAEPPAKRGDACILAEADEVQAPYAGLRHGVPGQLVGEVEARLLLVGGGLDPRDHAGGDGDAGHLLVDEAQRPGRPQDRDRRQDRGPLGDAEAHRLGHEVLQQARREADLELEEAGAGPGLLQRPLCPVLERRRAGVLHGSEEEMRRRLDRPSAQVAAGGDRARGREQLRAVEVEDAPGLGLVAGAHVIACQAADVLDAVRRRADDLRLEREPVAVAAHELHD